jgi:hypothetical protein
MEISREEGGILIVCFSRFDEGNEVKVKVPSLLPNELGISASDEKSPRGL